MEFRIDACMRDIFVITVSRYCCLTALCRLHLEVQLVPFWVSVTKVTIDYIDHFINEAENHVTICRVDGASEMDFEVIANLDFMVTEVKGYRESLVDLIRGKEWLSPESYQSIMSKSMMLPCFSSLS